MSRKISFTYEDKDYVLEYDRKSVLKMEDDKINIEEMTEKPFTSMFVLFKYSFYKHNKAVFKNDDKIAEILGLLPDKENLMLELTNMLNDTVAYLGEPEDPKNAIAWTTI